LPGDPQRVAYRKLIRLDAATRLETLSIPPGNRLQPLSGNRGGQHGIRINDQWRVCFVWRDGDAYDVEITDHHRGARMNEERLSPVHPGEVLLEDFLKPMGISQYRLAKALGVPVQRVHDLVHGRRAMTADTALRLARFFAMEAQFWMNLQTRYDLARTADVLADRLDREVQPFAA
jgi:addiction module HigA family antidote